MMKTKAPLPRAGKSRRAPAVAVAKAEGSSPSGELEHVSLSPFLSDRPRAALTPFGELLEESRHPPPPPPPPALQPQPQASPMDADEPVEETDCCILTQDFFCTPDYITPDAPQIASGFEVNKENIPCPKSPEKSVNARSKRYKRDCSPKGLRSTDFMDSWQVTPVQWVGLSRDDSEDEQPRQPSLQKRVSYVSQSAVALRCQVLPPPCIKNLYLNTDPRIDDDVFCGRQYKSSGFSPSIGGDGLSRYRTDFHEIECCVQSSEEDRWLPVCSKMEHQAIA